LAQGTGLAKNLCSQIKVKEKDMEEKKVLSIEEIEAQTFLDLSELEIRPTLP